MERCAGEAPVAAARGGAPRDVAQVAHFPVDPRGLALAQPAVRGAPGRPEAAAAQLPAAHLIAVAAPEEDLRRLPAQHFLAPHVLPQFGEQLLAQTESTLYSVWLSMFKWVLGALGERTSLHSPQSLKRLINCPKRLW